MDHESSARTKHRDRILSLYSDLAEVESEIAQLQAEKERIRSELSMLIAEAGGKVNIPGVARMELTRPSVLITYDRKAMDALMNQLVADGMGSIAARIRACQKEAQRAGSLRITPERNTP